MPNTLRKVEIFQNLSDEELNALAANCERKSAMPDELVIEEGEAANSLYIIETGTVKVLCRDDRGNEYVINTQGANEYFGELALVDDMTRSSSVIAQEACSFRVMHKEQFYKILEDFPAIVPSLLRNLTRRVRGLTDNIKNLALQDVYSRVARVLMSLSEEAGDGSLYIPELLTKQDIADRVGASKDMVSGILKNLVLDEYIRFDDGHIVINTRLPADY
ncbi:Crp/Fnr family transcriptional regulator [Marinobacter alexandrii]|uniref:Crp/Fnr family transcriptional regulator n=1 Tax=Marinobacter alexandrii TaxID=2570351 RepID=UPI003297BB08